MPTSHQATVSAIIPVYNGQDRIARAIESALSQTHPIHEVIVVDDGSTDDTASVVAGYQVKYIRQPNGGPAAARNAGAILSTGEWLAFLDHDDTWHQEKTETQLTFGNDSEVGVIYCALKKIDQVPMTWDHLWARNIVGSPSGVLVRRRCFFEVGGFDCRRPLIGTEDHHLWMRIALAKWRMVRCPFPLFNYAPSDRSLSNQYQKMAQAEWASCEDIGHRAGLREEIIQRRKLAIANHYVRECIGDRDMAGAKKLIAAVGSRNISPDLLAAAFSPEWLLNLRKKLLRRLRGASCGRSVDVVARRAL